MIHHFIVNTNERRVVAVVEGSLNKLLADAMADMLTCSTGIGHMVMDDLPEDVTGNSIDFLESEMTVEDVLEWAKGVELAMGTEYDSLIHDNERLIANVILAAI